MDKKQIEVKSLGEIELGAGLRLTVINYQHGLISGQIFRRCKPDSLDRDELEKELNNPHNILPENLKTYFSTPKRSFEHYTADILKKAGVLDKSYPLGCDFSTVPKKFAPDQKVIDSLSKEEKCKAKEIGGDNWDIIAALYYVQRNFPMYSQEFYAAVWRYYYFVEQDDYRVGYLASEMGWKISYESAAYEGFSARISRESATKARQKKAPISARNRRQIIAELYIEVCELDYKNKRNGRAAARAIYELATKRKPKALLIKKENAIIGVDAISKHLRALQREGTI